MKKWLLRLAILLVLAGMAGAGSLVWLRARLTEPGSVLGETTVVIARGEGMQAIADQLREAGVIDSPWLFLIETKLTGNAPLRAGEYAFPARANLASVIDMMRKGQVVVHRFTLAEGLTVTQVLRDIRMAKGLTGGAGTVPEEGSLLPQTYFYTYGDTREAVVLRMTRAMNDLIDDLWPKRKSGLYLSHKIEAITLASIVERETAVAEERPHVAAVFYNRLKKAMRLQSDPTTIYAVSQGEGVLDRPLTKADLALKNPYNTYASDGLPPGPICNPGRASLEAVLNPADSDDLYFVADGQGRHVFARTLAEHNKNVAALRARQQQ